MPSTSLAPHSLVCWRSTGTFTQARTDPTSVRILHSSPFLGDYVLNYLTTYGTKMSPNVRLSLISLVCRITKLSWLTDTRQRNLLEIINQCLNKDVPYALLGLQFFSELVTQFNIPASSMTSLLLEMT